MISIEQLECMVKTLQSNSNDVPIEVTNEYNQAIMNFQTSADGLLWCLANFSALQSPTLLSLVFSTFRQWIQNDFDGLTTDLDIIQQIKDILFIHIATKLDSILMSDVKSILPSLSAAQYFLMTHLYPKYDNFWQDILSMLPPELALNFLTYFVQNNPTDIILSMQMDNSELLVTNFVIKCFLERKPEAYSILTQMLQWIDPTPLLDASVISLIQVDLQNPEKMEDSIKLLNGILSSSIAPEIFNKLLESLNIIERMMDICQNPDYAQIMSSASSLISACARFFFNTSLSGQYYKLALLLLSHQQVDVAETIVGFVTDYASLHPEAHHEAFIALTNRLVLYFTTNPSEIDEFASSLLKGIIGVVKFNQQILSEYVGNMIQSMANPQTQPEFPYITALFNILIDARDEYINIDNICLLLGSFSPLLRIPPPLEQQSYYAVTAFLKYFCRIEQGIDHPDFIPLFKAAFDTDFLHLNTDYSEEQNKKFIDISEMFVRAKHFKNIDVSPEHVTHLVQTGDFDKITIASKLLAKFNEAHRVGLLLNCMDITGKLFEGSENKITTIQAMLILIQKSGIENPEPILPYMSELGKYAAANSEVMVMYLQTLFDLLGEAGLKFFMSFLSSANDMESLRAICANANKYIQKGNDKSWSNDFILQLFPKVNEMIKEVNFGDLSEETRQAKELLLSFFGFATHSCLFISSEVNIALAEFTKSLISVLLPANSLELLNASIEFLISLVSSPDVVLKLCDEFIPLTFGVVCFPLFNASVGKWLPVIRSITKFHHVLIKSIPNETAAKITNTFAQFPRSEILLPQINAYIQILQQERIEQFEVSIREFFSALNSEAQQ